MIDIGLGMRFLEIGPWLIGIGASLMSASVAVEQPSVTVNIGGIRSQQGNVIVCLWRQQDKEFPICSSTASFEHISVAATAATVTVTFQNVSSGEYAVSAFHDQNRNGKIDRGFMGQPEEGIAFSNMAQSQARASRPSFDQAKFTVNSAKTISLSLIYL